ncbi:MAG: hypothetical protein KDA84_07675, partial [Planctomycetaceae bacterium]|nr:hypothetical protein [Planctomycetaceae bacterium]
MPDHRSPSFSQDNLLVALRVWWPQRSNRDQLADQLRHHLENSFQTFRKTVPQTKISKFEKLWPIVAHSLTQDFLSQSTLKGIETELGGFISQISISDLGDVFWMSAVYQNDGAANTALLNRIQTVVQPAVQSRWGRQKGQTVADDLPSQLLKQSQRGFNRGMA